MTELIGRSLGQYRIMERIGEGGMATVYKAYQPSLDRYVAIKVLPPLHARQPGFSERFRREAQASASLHHSNILPVYDFGQEDEYSYIVMQYVEGARTLKEVMQTSLTLEQASDLIGQIAAALDHAHQRGIVHRDVKPGNVLMDGERALLTDFGLARMAESAIKLTGTGVGVGTPAYMSPEQGQGEPADLRSDIYSLGVVLFEMLTGRIPHQAETPLATILKRLTEPLPLPRSINPAIPEAVERVILKALSREPQGRFASAGEMARALKEAVNEAAAQESAPAPIDEKLPVAGLKPALPARRALSLKWAAGVLAAVVIVVLAVWGGMAWGKRSQSTETPTTVASAPTATLTATSTATPTETSALSPTRTATPEPTNTPPPASTDTPRPTATNAPTRVAAATPGIGSTRVWGKDGMVMVYVPAGEFLMGSTDADKTALDSEKPQHTVYLDAFWIDRTEVTNAQYKKCVDAGGCTPPSDSLSITRNSYYGNAEFDDYPVIYVSWMQSNAYCQWAGRRLPTEAEWEKAARGTDGRTYPWGESISCNAANYLDCVGDTVEVGSYPAGASPYGALDMAGNVLERVADWYDSAYYGKSPAQNPTGPASGGGRVLRGGSWRYFSAIARAANRYGLDVSGVHDDVGFRCASSGVE